MVSLIRCCDAFQYETAMCCENPGSIQPGSEDTEALQTGCENPLPIQPVAYHTVNRRYSEFLNLQTRLEEKAELRKLIKGKMEGAYYELPVGKIDVKFLDISYTMHV